MELLKDMDSFKKRKVIKRIRNIAILLVIVAVLFFIFVGGNSNKQQTAKLNIEELKKRTITNSISASGVIKAENSKSITSSSVGLKVETVNVKEGDEVLKGDVICTFDTTDLRRRLREAEANLAKTKADINSTIATANSNQTEQINNLQTQLDNAKKANDEANKNLETAKAEQDKANKELEEYKPTYDEAKQKYDEIKNANDEKVQEVELAQNEYDAEKLKPESEQDKAKLAELEVKLQKAKSELSANKNELIKAEAEFKPVEAKYNLLQNTADETEARVATLQTTVDTTKTTYDNLNTAMQNVKNNNALSNANLTSSSTAVLQAEVDTLKEQIKNATVVSPASGTITIVNVKEGDTYLGSVIAKVEGVQSFIVEAEIDEYDIPDVKVGQDVRIKTDATREEELEGVVTYVATAATENTSAIGNISGLTASTIMGASSNATFKTQIAISTQNDRLRIGMNARINIITENKENIWAVPYDAIQEKEDGTKFVEILIEHEKEDKKQEEIEKKEIIVVTGIEGNYYKEIISDELSAGMKIIIPERQSDSSLQQIIESMGAGAGI